MYYEEDAGNHDYYSPIESLHKYNTYDLVFGKEFEDAYPNLYIVKEKPLLIDSSLFVPWYYTEEDELWKTACKLSGSKILGLRLRISSSVIGFM